MTTQPKQQRPFGVWLIVMLQASLVMTIFLFGLAMGVYLHHEHFIHDEILNASPTKAALEAHQTLIFSLAFMVALTAIAIFSVFTFRLMRRVQAAQKEVTQRAITDGLTGLSNRRYFFDRFAQELDRARRYEANLSLIMIDIDNFKTINDDHGHPAGDIVLAEVARLLSANIRISDIITRYGGEEFAILIPSLGITEATQAAEKLRNVIEVNDLSMEGPKLNVTISAGVADIETLGNHGGSTKDALIRAADKSLSRAKAEGRNRVVPHDPASQPAAT